MQPAFLGEAPGASAVGLDRGIKPLLINALGCLTDPLGEAEPWPYSAWQFLLVAVIN